MFLKAVDMWRPENQKTIDVVSHFEISFSQIDEFSQKNKGC
jgi:hypothetical protein